MDTRARARGSRRRSTLLRPLLLLALLTAFAASAVPAFAAKAPRPNRFFWVARSTGWVHLRLDEVAESSHIHLYVAHKAHVPAWQAQDLVEAFESRIFPTDTRIFGYPAHLVPVDVALVPLDSMTLGYFDQSDVDPLGPGSDRVHSNHANVLFVRTPNTMPDRNKMADTEEVLAHELQHLIEYRVRVMQRGLLPEEDWLNEGLSFYGQIANGFWTPRDALKLDAACDHPAWPVTALNQNLSFLRHNARIAYGRAGLFVTYLAGRFGTRFARDLITSPLTGLAAVDAETRTVSSRLNISTVYADWGVAQYLLGRGSYGYGAYGRNLRMAPELATRTVSAYPFDSRPLGAAPFTLRPWGQAYYQFNVRGGRNLQLRIDTPGSTRIAAIMEDSTHALPPTVQWLRVRRSGAAVMRLNEFANIYDRVTLVVNYEPALNVPATQTTRIRVRATLVNVSDNNRPSRLTPAASHDPHLALRQILQLGEPVAIRSINPEPPRVTASNA